MSKLIYFLVVDLRTNKLLMILSPRVNKVMISDSEFIELRWAELEAKPPKP